MKATVAALTTIVLALPVQAARPDTPGNQEIFHFDAADDVVTFPSPGGRFVIHYTAAGRNAVPLADGDVSGVPDHVEELADLYEEVLDFYLGRGFRAPLGDLELGGPGGIDNGGDGKFDVYLVDFALSADGSFRQDGCLVDKPDQCIGYMVQENDFQGYGYPSTTYANRVLSSHEFFHAVQAAYDASLGSIPGEGTAVWATEQFDPALFDMEGFASGYLDHPDRSLDVPIPGPVDEFSYGSGVFFQFLGERFGLEVIRELYEGGEDGSGGVADPAWLTVLGDVLVAHGSSFAEAYVEFVVWNLRTGARADPAKSYAGGADYPLVLTAAARPPFQEDKLRVFHASAQIYDVEPDGRGTLTAALVGAAAELEGVQLLLAPYGDDVVRDPVRQDPPDQAGATVAMGGLDGLFVVVINTAPAGESQRPGLCIGDVDEVSACQAAILAAAEGEGEGEGEGQVNPPAPACGCSVADRAGDAAGLVLVVAGAGALRRRRLRCGALTSGQGS